jgi:hypothetical protein
MHFDSITEMCKFFGGVSNMLEYVKRRLAVHETVVPKQHYLKHVLINQDITINGFSLREINSFVEGQKAIINELKEDLVDNFTEDSFKKWVSIIYDKELSDEPIPDKVEPGVTVHTIVDEPAPFNSNGELNEQE